MLKYKVTINYSEFVFMDGSTALTFAEMAKAQSTTPDTSVEIEILEVEVDEDENDQ